MLKLRSIGARLILAISLTVAAACAILGTFSIMQQRALTQLALDQQLKLQYDSVIAALDYEGRAAQVVSATIAALPPVGDAILRDDRAGLTALLGDAMKAMRPAMSSGVPNRVTLMSVRCHSRTSASLLPVRTMSALMRRQKRSVST